MAALPYMQLYVSDYLADTAHLTTEEHGAYLLLLFNYWQTGKPLRKDRLAFVARTSNERWISVEETLKDFFHDDGKNWVHFRVEADLAAVNAKSKTNSDAGKASARARAAKKAEAATPVNTGIATNVPTNVEQSLQRNVNHTDTDTDIDTEDKSIGACAPGDDHFDQAWKAYPKREGANPKNKALSAWNARLKEGVTREAMLAGVQRYEAFSKAKGNIGTGYVMQAVRFFGTERAFENDWSVSSSQGKPSAHHGFDKIDYMAGVTGENDDGSFSF